MVKAKNLNWKVAVCAWLIIGSATHISAQSAAAPVKFVDRLFLDASATVHMPLNWPTFAGGLIGLGFDMRDFNLVLGAKIAASLVSPVITATNFGGRFEYKIPLIRNTLRLLPGIYGGIAQAKGSSGNGGSISINGYWIELGIGAEYFLTQEISAIFRPYYAFNKLSTAPDYADISALGFDFGVRYFFGQNRRLSY